MSFEATKAYEAGSDVYYWSWPVAAAFIFSLLCYGGGSNDEDC
jgi:hypothetical protein